MRVIGAGFGRTGTDSLRHALNILGCGPCHHMHEIMESERLADLWQEKTDGADVPWSTIFEGFGSTVDWPTTHYWRELVETYPDALVVMTYREPESWWASFSKTILPAIHNTRDGSDGKAMAWRVVGEWALDGRPHDKDHVIDIYTRHIEEVRRSVPSGRYLEMSLGEGWERLCEALGLPVPAEPYPSGNTTRDFRVQASLNS